MACAANSSSTAGGRASSDPSNRPSSGAKVRTVRSRRSTSRARCFAVAMSHAEGFSGTPELPHLQRAAEGVLHHVFCQREVFDAEDARQRGDHSPRFPPEEMLVQLHHMLVFRTGRTSTTPPPSKMGQPNESSTAWARSFASISV